MDQTHQSYHTITLQNKEEIANKKKLYYEQKYSESEFFRFISINPIDHGRTSYFSDILSQFSREKLNNITSKNEEILLTSSSRNNFFDSFFLPYNLHGEIILSPDDIWFQISLAFSQHVNINSEALREKFVSHKGKKKLIVYYGVDENPFKKDFRWKDMLREFEKEIAKNTKEDVVSLLSADFSTTGLFEKVVSQISIMDVFKSYFSYEMMTLCGINKIHFLGTLQDWEHLLEKTKKLAQYDAHFWIDQLEVVLQQFIETYKGNFDLKFWNNIFNDQTIHGSGGGTFISGWILTFFPYGPNNMKLLSKPYKELKYNIEDIPNYFANVPFVLELVDKSRHNMTFIAGFSGVNKIDGNKYKAKVSAAVAFADEEAKEANKKYMNYVKNKSKVDI